MNFSSQLKHNPHSLWLVSSSGLKCLTGKGEGFAGEGSNGRLGVGEVTERRIGEEG